MVVYSRDQEAANQAMDTWMALEKGLRDDVIELYKLHDASFDNQVLRRAFVRGVWGFKEGCLHGLNQFVRTVEYLSGDPHPRRPERRMATLQRMKLTLKWATDRLTPGWQPDFSGAGWRAAGSSLRVRDRLMHPKNASQLTIDDAAMGDVRDAMAWFLSSITELQTRALVRAHGVK